MDSEREPLTGEVGGMRLVADGPDEPPGNGLSGDAPSRERFVAALRQLAQTVTIVTTDGPAGRHGATVSAFCSVSVEPPTLLVCLHADSRIARRVLANGRFAVNLLDVSQSSLAARFAGPDAASGRFAGLDWAHAPNGSPALGEAAAFDCALLDAPRAGSHRIVTGRVVALAGRIAEPLLYRDGRYRRLAADSPRLPLPEHRT